ncbi:hypothetical protein STSP2_01349 [Anaerohalosphaera lusitana]|uniref:Colicin V production protein n=1 Tax=Anaerohalosphaera lusitana TaxID=1936003 RepID=A0A1U9NKD0_9BACT|nr:CvpA family protein [Anaerohalosphaera lusitana]AQT68194.1 hypothetical protein STSP2_01349 [Anaerohalosphaera lusitana]
MIFWLLLITALATAYLCLKNMNFYSMWQISFNLAVSIYLAIISAPLIVNLLRDQEKALPYNLAACMLLIAILSFVVLHIISTAVLGWRIEVTLPAFFETLGVGALGFISGYLIISFLLFTFCIMPITRKPCMDFLNGTKGPKAAFLYPVQATCSFVGQISLQPKENSVLQLAMELVDPGSKFYTPSQQEDSQRPEQEGEWGDKPESKETPISAQ